MSSSTKLVVGGAIVGLIAYCFYFDYQRRNNTRFRRELAKQRKLAKQMKHVPIMVESNAFELPSEPIPTTTDGREAYFMKHLQMGEQLMLQGPAAYESAATCFYRALQVYPEPQKLLEVLSQSIPEVIINLIIQKMAAEVRQAQSSSKARVEEVE